MPAGLPVRPSGFWLWVDFVLRAGAFFNRMTSVHTMRWRIRRNPAQDSGGRGIDIRDVGRRVQPEESVRQEVVRKVVL
jgi:hypothetical protein